MTKLQMNNSPCDSPVSTNERSLLRAVAGNRAFLGALVVSGAVFLYSGNSKEEIAPSQSTPVAVTPPVIPVPADRPVRAKVISSSEPNAKAESSLPETPEVKQPFLENFSGKKRFTAHLFMHLPYEELESSITELGLDDIEELSDLVEAFGNLQMAIESGDEEEIEALATEFLKIASKVETSEVTRKYWALMSEYRSTHEGSEDETDDKNPESHLYMIKSVLISARDYAEKLASL